MTTKAQAFVASLLNPAAPPVPVDAPDETPRWLPKPGQTRGDPKRQRPDGNWETSFHGILFHDRRYDLDRIDHEPTYAAMVYRELGDGDSNLGELRFSRALAEEHAADQARKFEESRADVSDAALKEAAARLHNEQLDSEIAALEGRKKEVTDAEGVKE